MERAERWLELHRHAEVGPCFAELRERGFQVYVADLDDEVYSPDTVPVDGPVAVLFGSELTGVSDEARALADGAICVPMRGLTESLNVGSAAACTIFRLAERRRALVGADVRSGDLAPASRNFVAHQVPNARRIRRLRRRYSSISGPPRNALTAAYWIGALVDV